MKPRPGSCGAAPGANLGAVGESRLGTCKFLARCRLREEGWCDVHQTTGKAGMPASYQPTHHKPSKALKCSPPWPLWEGSGKGAWKLNLSIFQIKVNHNNEGLHQIRTSRPLPFGFSGMAYSSGFHTCMFSNSGILFKNKVSCRSPL